MSLPDNDQKQRALKREWAAARIVVIEFADTDAAKRWYNSPEYQEALKIRLANSRGRVILAEGA